MTIEQPALYAAWHRKYETLPQEHREIISTVLYTTAGRVRLEVTVRLPDGSPAQTYRVLTAEDMQGLFTWVDEALRSLGTKVEEPIPTAQDSFVDLATAKASAEAGWAVAKARLVEIRTLQAERDRCVTRIKLLENHLAFVRDVATAPSNQVAELLAEVSS